MRHYDIAVLGTGSAGQKAAIQAAKLGKRVVAIERCNTIGGAQINTGTIPSKALREAAMHLTGRGQRGLFGESYRVRRDVTISDLMQSSRGGIRKTTQWVCRFPGAAIFGHSVGGMDAHSLDFVTNPARPSDFPPLVVGG